MDDAQVIRIIALVCATFNNMGQGASAERVVRQGEKFED